MAAQTGPSRARPGAPLGAGLMKCASARAHWQPGAPVLSEEDRAEWQTWRRNRILELQRDRRKRLRRIDYYPSYTAAALIDQLREHGAGGDASSILNRMVEDWGRARVPELNTRK